MTTATGNAQPRAEDGHGLFRDALADWKNDDVLQTREARAALGARHPTALRVLDWPELRAMFGKYDPPATRHGQRDRRFGLWSLGLAVLGLALAMLSPVAFGAERVVEIAAAVLVVAGLATMAVHRFGANSKARSLAQRFGAERVRALYFQAVINNLDLVAQAMTSDPAFAQWKATRARTLGSLPEPEDLPGQIPRLAGDVEDDAEAWVAREWAQSPPPPPPSADLDLLLSILRGQRLDSQIDYVERKLSASLGAPGQRAAVVRWLSRMLLAAAVITGLIAVALLVKGRPVGDTDLKLALEVTAGAIVAVMALGVLNDNQLLAGDAKRYAAYAAALSHARDRFKAGGAPEQVAALREVEVICYHDLREFIGAHWRAR